MEETFISWVNMDLKCKQKYIDLETIHIYRMLTEDMGLEMTQEYRQQEECESQNPMKFHR